MLGLCKHDPVIDTLRNVYHANVVAVPEERIRPLTVAARTDDRTSFRGSLSALLKQPNRYEDPPVQESAMPGISGSRTRQVDLKLGIRIMSGFLSAFGVPPAGIEGAFAGARKVDFSFGKVIRYWVDDNVLGAKLAGAALDRDNPAAAIYFDSGRKHQCYVLDSVIASSDFTVHPESDSSGNLKVDIAAIRRIVQDANAQLTVSGASDMAISFTGARQLGFAFSCVLATFDASGRIATLVPSGDVPPLGMHAAGGGAVHRARHVLLTETPAMLDTDFEDFMEDDAQGRGAADR